MSDTLRIIAEDAWLLVRDDLWFGVVAVGLFGWFAVMGLICGWEPGWPAGVAIWTLFVASDLPRRVGIARRDRDGA